MAEPADFVEGGWRVKPLVKLIDDSRAPIARPRGRDPTASVGRRADPEAVDPGNELLWRMRLRRLESEVVRDSILAVSGQLNPALGGPPVPIDAQPDGMVRGRQGQAAAAGRRVAPQPVSAGSPRLQPFAADRVRSAGGGHQLPGARRVGRAAAVAGDAQRRVSSPNRPSSFAGRIEANGSR